MLRRNYAKVYGLSKSRLGVLAVLRRRPTRHECRLGSFQLTPRLHAAYSRLHHFPLGPFPLAPIRPSYIQACSPSCAARRFSRCPASWRAVGRSPRAATSAPGLGSPRPHLRRDWAHPCHICTGTGLTPATSAPGLGRSCGGLWTAVVPGELPDVHTADARQARVCDGGSSRCAALHAHRRIRTGSL